MKRIAIIGSGGAGKSTLATRIGERLNIPVYHLDALFWRPGWVEPKREEWVEIQENICSKDEWIADGNYGGTMELRLAKCDTVIFLDLPRMTCILRVLKRSIVYRNRPRQDMAKNCPEKIDFMFIKWIWDYPKSRRPKILKKLKEIESDKRVLVLSSRRATNSFLASIENKNHVNKPVLSTSEAVPPTS